LQVAALLFVEGAALTLAVDRGMGGPPTPATLAIPYLWGVMSLIGLCLGGPVVLAVGALLVRALERAPKAPASRRPSRLRLSAAGAGAVGLAATQLLLAPTSSVSATAPLPGLAVYLALGGLFGAGSGQVYWWLHGRHGSATP
jgi:hypothetical protein